MTFKFELKSRVIIEESSEHGTVVGRAEYTSAEGGYLVHYKAADGRAVTDWWTESLLIEGW